MTVIVRSLNEEAARTLHEMCLGIYLDGQCYAFAIALHRGLGWPMVGLMQNTLVRHAMLRNPSTGTLHDARGSVPEEKLGRPFGISVPYELCNIKEGDLRALRPVHEWSIERATRMAEELWPELPWRDSLRERVSAFAEELEKLSREHGLWIRGTVPTQAPLLSHEDGQEAGYVLQPTEDGTTYSIDRSLDASFR